MSLGIFFAFLSAVFNSILSIYRKRSVDATDEYVSSFALRAFALVVLVPFLLILGIPDIDGIFWIVLAVSTITSVFGSLFGMKAYKYSEASLVAPIKSFIPVFVIFSGIIFVNEIPDASGTIGVLLVFIGTYFLKIESFSKHDIILPLKALTKEKGVMIMGLVAVVYGILGGLPKLGIQAASALTWAVALHITISIPLLILTHRNTTQWKTEIRDNQKGLLIMGLLSGFAIAFQVLAIERIFIVYALSLQRVSVVLTIILAYYLLDETDNLVGKLIGSLIMSIGAILISI